MQSIDAQAEVVVGKVSITKQKIKVVKTINHKEEGTLNANGEASEYQGYMVLFIESNKCSFINASHLKSLEDESKTTVFEKKADGIYLAIDEIGLVNGYPVI